MSTWFRYLDPNPNRSQFVKHFLMLNYNQIQKLGSISNYILQLIKNLFIGMITDYKNSCILLKPWFQHLNYLCILEKILNLLCFLCTDLDLNIFFFMILFSFLSFMIILASLFFLTRLNSFFLPSILTVPWVILIFFPNISEISNF